MMGLMRPGAGVLINSPTTWVYTEFEMDSTPPTETALQWARQRRRLRRLTNGFIACLALVVVFKLHHQTHSATDAFIKLALIALAVALLGYAISRWIDRSRRDARLSSPK